MKKYSKREFLRIMGLGIAFSPFISLYSACSGGVNRDKNDQGKADSKSALKSNVATHSAAINVTESDIILLKRDDDLFEKYAKGFNARIKKTPKYIALCKTSLGIQHAISLAKSEKLPIAVKSGGHSFEGFSTNEGGMVINLSQMKNIKWLDEDKVAIEPGCILQEVQDALFPKQKMIPTGSCGTVGIAGLTLGGGYGFFSRKYGLTCDNLIDIEFIDGQGMIQNASENPELFWALRGAGNGNFGVASKFIFETKKMPQTFNALVLKFRNLDMPSFRSLLEQWFSTTSDLLPEDFSAFVLNGNTLTILATSYGNQSVIAEKFKPLQAMAPNASWNASPLPKAMKRYYGRKGPIFFKNASAGYYNSFQELNTISPHIFDKVNANKGLIFQINTLGGAINTADFEKQSAYPHRALPYLSELQAYWDNPSQEAKLTTAFEDIQTFIRSVGIRAQYRNYPDINFPDWQHAYYGKNYERLQKLKSNLDPDNLFRFAQSIEPLS